MVINIQEPEKLVYHHVRHNFDYPFAIAVYKETYVRLGLQWSHTM